MFPFCADHLSSWKRKRHLVKKVLLNIFLEIWVFMCHLINYYANKMFSRWLWIFQREILYSCHEQNQWRKGICWSYIHQLTRQVSDRCVIIFSMAVEYLHVQTPWIVDISFSFSFRLKDCARMVLTQTFVRLLFSRNWYVVFREAFIQSNKTMNYFYNKRWFSNAGWIHSPRRKQRCVS